MAEWRWRPDGPEERSDARLEEHGAVERRPVSDGYRDDDEDIFTRTHTPDDAAEDLFSRVTGARSNREFLDSGAGLPRTRETITEHAARAGIDLTDVGVEIVEDPDTVRYLDHFRAMARTDSDGIQLGPACFADPETLVRALAHERTHVEQYRQGRIDTNRTPLEDEAYATEGVYIDRWKGASP